jgi:hypothetical protein
LLSITLNGITPISPHDDLRLLRSRALLLMALRMTATSLGHKFWSIMYARRHHQILLASQQLLLSLPTNTPA